VKLLLDTCTFLWLNGELGQLPARVLAACESAENELYLSAASVWEIAVKWGARRLELPEEPALWVPRRREDNGIDPLPVSEEAAAQVAKLPPLHKDPFDRMLVCQAITEGLAGGHAGPAHPAVSGPCAVGLTLRTAR
jgi:PIN domain nuclease of toxin-antitoxin system